VALSADGTTLAAGSRSLDNCQGGIQVYVLSGTTWQLQATLSQNLQTGREGDSVALSADGTILATGVFLSPSSVGALIYIRSGTTWHYVTTLSRKVPNSYVGYTVALSADGSTLAAGCDMLGDNAGGTDIYVQSNNTWQLQATLTQHNFEAAEGYSVALSQDGNTLAAGAFHYCSWGAILVYVRSGGIWQHQATLTQLELAYEGVSVDLSADGNTLAAGANVTYEGATIIYVRSGNKWQEQATVSQHKKGAYEGWSVALSTNGSVLAVGAPGSPVANSSGVVYIYAKINDIWQYQTTLSQELSAACEGYSIALSANGTILAAGAPKAGTDEDGLTSIYINATKKKIFK